MSIYEEKGMQSPVYMCINTCILGGSEGMLPERILDGLRLLLVHSQGLCIK